MWRVFLLSAQGGASEPIFEKRVPGAYAVSSKTQTWQQYKKRQIQVPGTTFSTSNDGVCLGGGHGNCCRFATLTGVHQSAHICLSKLWFKAKVGS